MSDTFPGNAADLYLGMRLDVIPWAALPCRNLQYKIAARIFNASEPAAWATGPYFPYPNLNITGHVLVWPPIPAGQLQAPRPLLLRVLAVMTSNLRET